MNAKKILSECSTDLNTFSFKHEATKSLSQDDLKLLWQITEALQGLAKELADEASLSRDQLYELIGVVRALARLIDRAWQASQISQEHYLLLNKILINLKKILNQESVGIDLLPEQIAFLYRLWAYFCIYQVEPEIPQGFEDFAQAKVIQLDKCWQITDYSGWLATSSGEDYGTYTTGKLIHTAHRMVAIIKQQGATTVSVEGDATARFAAWCQCQHLGITVDNYFPNTIDVERYQLLERSKSLDLPQTPPGRNG